MGHHGPMSSTESPDGSRPSGTHGRPVAVTRKPSDSIDDWGAVVADLNRLLRLKTTPIGMKLFESVADMEAVPRIRRPQQVHTADQIVSMASRLNWTVGITNDDLVGSQCGAVLGLRPQDDEWRSGAHMAGVWFETVDDSAAHQAAMPVVPAGRFTAMAVVGCDSALSTAV